MADKEEGKNLYQVRIQPAEGSKAVSENELSKVAYRYSMSYLVGEVEVLKFMTIVKMNMAIINAQHKRARPVTMNTFQDQLGCWYINYTSREHGVPNTILLVKLQHYSRLV